MNSLENASPEFAEQGHWPEFEFTFAHQLGVRAEGFVPYDHLVALNGLTVEVEDVVKESNDHRPDHNGKSWVIVDPRQIAIAHSQAGNLKHSYWWLGYENGLTALADDGSADRQKTLLHFPQTAGRLIES